MDANERLTFINRLNGLSGDQAREALKQMAMNCSTKHTTIARALRVAVDQHGQFQYVAPVSAQSSPAIATRSTAAADSKKKAKARHGGFLSDCGEEGSDHETTNAKVKKEHEKEREHITLRSLSLAKKDKRAAANDRSSRRDNKHGKIKEGSASGNIIDSESVKVESDISDSETSADNRALGNGISNHDASDDDNCSSSDESDSETSDMSSSYSESSDSEESIRLTNSSTQRRVMLRSTSLRRASESTAQAAKNKIADFKESALSDSAKKRKGPQEQDVSAVEAVAKKRKASTDDKIKKEDMAENLQKVRRGYHQTPRRPTEERTCRTCLELFPTRTMLFEHLDKTSHFCDVPTPVVHSSMPAPNVQPRSEHLYPSRYIPSTSHLHRPRLQDLPQAQRQAGRQVEPDIKKEPGDETKPVLASSPLHKAIPARERSMAPPSFIRHPNNFPRGPTPAPLAHTRQITGGVKSPMSQPLESTPAQVVESHYLCKMCGRWYNPSTDNQPPCRRHDGRSDPRAHVHLFTGMQCFDDDHTDSMHFMYDLFRKLPVCRSW